MSVSSAFSGFETTTPHSEKNNKLAFDSETFEAVELRVCPKMHHLCSHCYLCVACKRLIREGHLRYGRLQLSTKALQPSVGYQNKILYLSRITQHEPPPHHLGFTPPGYRSSTLPNIHTLLPILASGAAAYNGRGTMVSPESPQANQLCHPPPPPLPKQYEKIISRAPTPPSYPKHAECQLRAAGPCRGSSSTTGRLRRFFSLSPHAIPPTPRGGGGACFSFRGTAASALSAKTAALFGRQRVRGRRLLLQAFSWLRCPGTRGAGGKRNKHRKYRRAHRETDREVRVGDGDGVGYGARKKYYPVLAARENKKHARGQPTQAQLWLHPNLGLPAV